MTIEPLVRQLQGKLRWGPGSPEGKIEARRGTLYLREDGGAATTFYVKESDAVAGNAKNGWIAK